MGWEVCINWIHVSQNMDQWWAYFEHCTVHVSSFKWEMFRLAEQITVSQREF